MSSTHARITSRNVARRSVLDPPPDFVGRRDLHEALRAWLDDDGGERHFVIAGAPGSGKSAALARVFAGDLAELGGRDAVAVAHFCVPGNLETRNPIVAAESLVLQLVECLDDFGRVLAESSSDRPVSVQGSAVAETVSGTQAGVLIQRFVINTSAEEVWRRLLSTPLRLLFEAGCHKRVIIVLDGLDEADRYDGPVRLADLVAGMADAPSSVRFLLATRADEALLERLGVGRTRLWNFSTGKGLDESRCDVLAFLGTAAKRLTMHGKLAAECDATEFARQAARRSEGSFLYARLLMDAVEAGTAPISLRDLDRIPTGLEEAYGSLLRQVVGDDEERWLGRIEPVLSTLSAAQEPLSESQVHDFTGLRLPTLRASLRILQPFLVPDEPTAARRHAFRHTTFRDYLTDPEAAGDWYCDAEDAHRRIVSACHRRTGGWQHDQWGAVDAYGLRHVITHVRASGEPPSTIDEIATPSFLQAVGRQDTGLATVDQQLRTLLENAVVQADLGRALRWAWVRHRLRDHLAEQLAYGGASVLVRAGRTAEAWASLSSLDPQHWTTRAARRNLVVALARGGQADVAAAVVAEAGTDRERSVLRAELATALGLVDPERALSLVEPGEARDDGLGQLCAALAGHRDHVDDAWRVAGDDATAQHAVVRAAAGHSVERAAALARQVKGADERSFGEVRWRSSSAALGDVCVAAAATDPRFVERVLGQESLVSDDLARVAFALALRGDPSFDETVEHARGNVRSHVLVALIDAAWGRALDAANHAQALDRDCFAFHRGDVDVIARIELERLRDGPEASRLAARALRHVADNVMAHPFERPGGGFAALAGALALFDLEAALQLADQATGLRVAGAPHRVEILEGVVARLTPVDPEAAWRVAEEAQSHGVLVAWCRAFPRDFWDAAARHVESIDRQFSSTRVVLIGELAARLRSHDQARNAMLADMLPRPTESAKFNSERQASSAALRRRLVILDRPVGLPPLPDEPVFVTTRDMKLQADAVIAARRGEPFTETLDSLRSPSARIKALALLGTVTDADVAVPLATAAEAMASAERLPITVLADAIAGLLPRSLHSALTLAEEVDHPLYLPLSVHQPLWIALEAVMKRVCRIWHDADEPLPALARRLIDRAMIGGSEAYAAVLLDCLLRSTAVTDRCALDVWAREELPGMHATLTGFCAAATGGLDAGSVNRWLPALPPPQQEHLLRRLATVDPNAAWRLCEEHLELALDADPLHAVLAEVATANPAHALALHRKVEWRGADARDALHAIARVTAETRWSTAMSMVVESIPYDSARGLALHDLAAVAITHPAPEPRVSELLEVLSAGARLDPFGKDYTVRGVIAALRHSNVEPRVLARLIELAGTITEFDNHLNELTALVTNATDVDEVMANIKPVEHLLEALD